MRNKPFPYFDDFVIIFKKDKATREGAETAIEVVEKANDDKDEFVDANDNYYEDPQKEKEEGNWEDTTTSTCNTAAATSRRNETSKKKTKSSNGTGELVEQLFNF